MTFYKFLELFEKCKFLSCFILRFLVEIAHFLQLPAPPYLLVKSKISLKGYVIFGFNFLSDLAKRGIRPLVPPSWLRH